MADFEPVEIDFMYGGNTQAEGARIIKTTEEIAAAQVKAKADIERHNAAILELKKDLVGLGTAYKQAMSTQQKSEILTEIELTKKNILDETAAVKQLKAELVSLNKVPASSPALDSQKVGKAAVGYSSLNFSTQQLVRELPAATMGLNMFFLAISNNIPVLTDGIKRARAENEALKASGAATTPVWKQLAGSIMSWQTAMMVGITLLAMYGKDIAAFVSKLFMGREAIDKTAESQKALNKVFSDFTGEAFRRIESVTKIGIEIQKYGDKSENSKKIIDDFNKTFNTHLTTIEQVKAEYPRLSKAAIESAIKIQAANSLIEKSAKEMIRQQQSENILSQFSPQQISEASQRIDKFFNRYREILKKDGFTPEQATTRVNAMADAIKNGDLNGWIVKAGWNGFDEELKKVRMDFRTFKDDPQMKKVFDDLGSKNGEAMFKAILNSRASKVAQKKLKDETTKLLDGVDFKNFTDNPDNPDNLNKSHTEAYNAKKAITDLILDLEAQRSKMELEMQSDSLQKRLKAIDLEEAAEIRKIQEKEAAIVEAYNKSHKGETGFTAKTTLAEVDPTLAAELSAQKDGISSAFDQKRFAAAEKWKNELLQLAQRYGDESARIEAEYNARIQKLAQSGFIIQAAELTKERDERLSGLETSLIKETELYKLATTDQLNISKQLTSMLIAETRKRIEEDTKLTAADRDILLEKLNKADYIVQKTDNPFADLIDGVEKYRKAREEQSQYNAGLDLENFARLEDAANEAQKATLQAAAGALQQVGSIIREITNELDDLTDAQRKTVNEIENIVMGAAALAEGLATGNPATIASGSIQLLINLYKVLDTKAKETEALLQRNKDAVEALNMAYDNLSDAIDKAFGTEKARLIQEQIELLKQKKAILEESRQIELSKDADYRKPKWWEYAIPGWNTYQIAKGLLRPKTDDAAVSEYTKEIAEIERQIAERAEDATVEAISGTSVMSAIDEFADAYASAFTSAEDAALKSADVVRNILKTALVEKLKEDLAPGIRVLMDMVANAMLDGFLSEEEKAAIYAQNEKNTQVATADQKMFEELGLAETEKKGIQGDVAKMTEQTGTALTGQITAMRFNVMQLLTNSKSSIDIMSRQLATLEEIKNNTAFCRKLERMDENINYLKINGIKVN